MNTTPTIASHSTKKTQPFNVLFYLVQHHFSGCLQVVEKDTIWCIYLKNGELIYGTKSSDAFRRLKHLLFRIGQQLSCQVSEPLTDLINNPKIEQQFRLYEQMMASDYLISPDYQIICWLIDQNYLDNQRASIIIESISKKAISSLSKLKNGTCNIFPLKQENSVRTVVEVDISAIIKVYQDQQLAEQKGNQTVNQNGQYNYPEVSMQQTDASVSHPESRQAPQLDPAIHPLPPPKGRSQLSSLASNVATNTQITCDSLQRPVHHSVNGHDTQISPSIQKVEKRKYVIGCIDDSPAVLNKLKECLDSENFTVFTVDNPVKALMTIIRNNPDLVILDVMMPSVDGYELCALLRKHPKFRKIPIIIITSNTGIVDRAKAKMVEASGYLNKPFTKDELLQKISSYLNVSS